MARDGVGVDPFGLSVSCPVLTHLVVEFEGNMKRLVIIVLAILAIGLGLLSYYLYAGSTVPNGQQALVRIGDSNFSSVRESFNSSASSVRVIVMLSPT
jgi:hypothetical protein